MLKLFYNHFLKNKIQSLKWATFKISLPLEMKRANVTLLGWSDLGSRKERGPSKILNSWQAQEEEADSTPEVICAAQIALGEPLPCE